MEQKRVGVLVIKNEKIYVRGACDDKGQVYVHVKAFEVIEVMMHATRRRHLGPAT